MSSDSAEGRLDRAVRHICRNSASLVGPTFFPAMAQDLAELLECEFAFVGELVEAGDAVETIAVWAEGKLGEPFRYALCDTPCEVVIGSQACVYPDRVASLFPKDELLAEMGIRGYVGFPMTDSEGAPFGIVVALGRSPIADVDFSLSVISVFAGRIAAELERLRATRRAARFEVQALQAQKLESLGVLAGGLAHDFNNLLSSMLGSVGLAQLELPAEHAALRPLETIHKAASTAGALCRQLLAYAGKGCFRIEPTSLSELVREQTQLLEAATEDDVSLELELNEGGSLVDADRGQVSQILLNLVRNASEAIQATGTSGHVRVSTGVLSCSADYLRSTYLKAEAKPGKYGFLEISDDGPGMSEEVKRQLFDPFFTTKFSGRGLGLAAILGIVKAHSGTIKVYSEFGRGSSFKVFFPLSASAGLKPSLEAPPSEWRGSGKALFVDDDDLLREVGARMLQAIGFEPLVAADGVEALRHIDERGQDLKLVVLDLSMPRMGGEEAFREIRARFPDLPVVLTSGFNEQDTVRRFLGRGLAGFLQKPFQLRVFRECMRKALTKAES